MRFSKPRKLQGHCSPGRVPQRYTKGKDPGCIILGQPEGKGREGPEKLPEGTKDFNCVQVSRSIPAASR